MERAHRDGSILYAVKHLSYVANRDRDWEFEPIPSSRDDEFIARTRWAEWEDAAYVAQHMAREELLVGPGADRGADIDVP